MQPPETLPGVAPWFFAFWELSTERRFSGGPIPLSAINAWPVPPDEAELFHDCIRAADAAYLAHIAKPPEDRVVGVASPSAIKGSK